MSIPKDLERLGFAEPSDEIRNLVMDIYGTQGQGKTHFACTAPGPIAYFNFDYGAKGVIKKFQDEGKIVYEKIIDIPDVDKEDIEKISAEAKPIWNDFASAWKKVMTMPHVRTVIIDTATEAYELLRIYKFGKLTEVLPHMYGPVKAVFRRTLKIASSGNVHKNLIMINKMKDEYVGRNSTGKKIEAGFDDAPYIADVAGQLIKRLPTKRDPEAHFGLKIAKCRINTDIEGEVFEDELCTFPIIASMVVPGTSPEDWE